METDNLRIGVYVCHCGVNISNMVDVAEVARFAGEQPCVAVSRDYQFMCSDPGQNMIVEDIREHNLNRVIVASCSPRMHEPTFRKACLKGGINPYLFQMVNIREHCSWVHTDKKKATEKARALVNGAIMRVARHDSLPAREVKIHPDIMIVGAGIAGIDAALRIAASGYKVHLVEKSSTIGGRMAMFDKTFPTLDCAACILTPKMVSVAQNPDINLLTLSEVTNVTGSVGNFSVEVKSRPRYVDAAKCTACGTCIEKCPKKYPDPYNFGMSRKKAIDRAFPQAVPNIPYIDPDMCIFFEKGKCRACEKFCPTGAVNFDDKETVQTIHVGSIIAATGFDLIDNARLERYGYGIYEDVYTSLEFERLNNATGPTQGAVLKKNGEEPKSVAIIHCVGSRDSNAGKSYCSRVCCMYSLKFAHLVGEKTNAEIYEFYIDIRSPGKGYEEFYDRVREEGIHFIRGKVARIDDVWRTEDEQGKLIVHAEDTLAGIKRRVPVDMVVLSLGLQPSKSAGEIAHLLGIAQDKDGFFIERHPKLAPVETASDGVFVAGCCQGPKDIPDTVAQAGAAAAASLALAVKGTVTTESAVSHVNEDFCAGCKICIGVCPSRAIDFIEYKGVSRVNSDVCKGCGLCAATCPSKAISLYHFDNKEILSEVEGILI